MRSIFWFILIASPLSSPWQLLAQPSKPLGKEFRVNTSILGSQTHAQIGVDGRGNFIVVWQSIHEDAENVLAQNFAADGSPLGAEFQVNVDTVFIHHRPRVSRAPNGDTVIVWVRYFKSPFPGENQILARRYTAAGQPAGDAFIPVTDPPGTQFSGDVAVAPDGSFFIVWWSPTSVGDDISEDSIQGRFFNADGTPRGDDFQVNTMTADRQIQPSVELVGDVYIALWRSGRVDFSDRTGIVGRRFDTTGAPLGDDFQISTDAQDFPVLWALAGGRSGRFAASWAATSAAERPLSIRFFTPSGVAAGDPLILLEDHAFTSSLATLETGDFFIAHSETFIPSENDIVLRRHDAAGRPREIFVVSGDTSPTHSRPDVAATTDGQLVVAWDGIDGSDRGIYARLVQGPTLEIFADGFESGTTGGWTTTQP